MGNFLSKQRVRSPQEASTWSTKSLLERHYKLTRKIWAVYTVLGLGALVLVLSPPCPFMAFKAILYSLGFMVAIIKVNEYRKEMKIIEAELDKRAMQPGTRPKDCVAGVLKGVLKFCFIYGVGNALNHGISIMQEFHPRHLQATLNFFLHAFATCPADDPVKSAVDFLADVIMEIQEHVSGAGKYVAKKVLKRAQKRRHRRDDLGIHIGIRTAEPSST